MSIRGKVQKAIYVIAISTIIWVIPAGVANAAADAPTIISLTNAERSQAGAQSLGVSSALSRAAQAKVGDMIAKSYFAHVSPDGVSYTVFASQAGYSYTLLGENLAMNFSSSSGVVSGWMASPTHRANVLNPKFTETGVAVGVKVVGEKSITYVAAYYGTPRTKVVAQTQQPKAPTPSAPAPAKASQPAPVVTPAPVVAKAPSTPAPAPKAVDPVPAPENKTELSTTPLSTAQPAQTTIDNGKQPETSASLPNPWFALLSMVVAVGVSVLGPMLFMS